MKTWPLLLTGALTLTACELTDQVAPCPTDTDTETASTADTGTRPTSPGLTQDETDGLATWTASSVQFELPGDKTVSGHEIGILIPITDVGRLDVNSTMTRAQDYNSSRSNNSSLVEIDDDPALEARWDGIVCEEIPCLSGGREREASRRLLVDPGDALKDGELTLSWAETTPRTVPFSGYLTLGVEFRGHVTVLKAADNGQGGIDLTTPLDEVLVWVPDPTSPDSPLYEATPVSGTNPLATVAGTTGASWPHGVHVTETALGLLVSLTW